jgi:type I restriction enzyme, S subunit
MIYLKSADFINTLCNKATIAHYTAEKVEMSPVLLPTSNEQLLISAFLDHETAKIDNLIEKQKQLIELLKEKRQAVISHAVTKGITPDVPMKDSGVEWLGEVPEHWDIPKLLHVTRTIGDGLHSTPEYDNETGYYFINGNNLVNGKISIGVTAKEVSKSEYNKHYVHLDEASVLLSINGTIGNVAVYNNERIILGKSAAYVKCGDKLNVNYLMYCFITDEARYYFDLEVTGTTIFNLSLNSIRQMKVCIPPLEEQKLIIDYCFAQENKYNYLIHSADTAIKLMQERRTALISAAVTGKIDVRNWVAPEAKKAEVSQEATA